MWGVEKGTFIISKTKENVHSLENLTLLLNYHDWGCCGIFYSGNYVYGCLEIVFGEKLYPKRDDILFKIFQVFFFRKIEETENP